MKKIITVLLSLAMVFSFASCGDKAKVDVGLVAFCSAIESVNDQSFNQACWTGVEAIAKEYKLDCDYWTPEEDTTDARMTNIDDAVSKNATVIVVTGTMYAEALCLAAEKYPQVSFIGIDINESDILKYADSVPSNITGIVFKEEQAGYLAGYAVVSEGYTKLGFSGGGGGTNPACERYGYGFVQGAEAAAAEKDVDVEMRYSWDYGSSYSASQDLQAMLNGWYESGTECIFECGGTMAQSAFAAASANDAFVVGVDTDQSGLSETVVTSAMKDLAGSVDQFLTKFYAGEWDTIGGTTTTLGAANDAVGIPTATWSLANWTVDDYNALFEQVKSGDVTVDNEVLADPSTKDWTHVKFVK